MEVVAGTELTTVGAGVVANPKNVSDAPVSEAVKVASVSANAEVLSTATAVLLKGAEVSNAVAPRDVAF